MTGVAIVIPMLNEAAGLPRLLRSLAALEPPPAEVLAVDGGSADASVAIAEAAGLLVFRHETRGRAAAIIIAIDGSERRARNVMSELSAERTRLAQLWEEHMRHEFQTCSTEDTLATMVEDSYVNHVPVMTGGGGHAELRQFYATHFIPKMPPDMEMMPLSRTIGTDQLVDEMVVRFTHTVEMDW